MAWPDIVGLLVDYLDAQIDDPVATRVPNPCPDTHVQVRRVGGPKRPPVREQPRVDLLVRAPTEPQAMELLLELRAIVNALHGTTTLGVTVYRVEETMGPQQDDDELNHKPMAWMTFALLIRADDAIR